MDEDQKFHRFPRIPKSLNLRTKKDESDQKIPKNAQFYPIPIPIMIDSSKRNDLKSESEYDEDIPRTSSKLDKWDRGARAWLSSGTMFLLIVLFHVIQVRSDLRRFTSAANIQLHEACSVLEDKTVSLQSALGLAAQDIGPISFKFVRDLKTKVRGAFHFAGQIFGGRVREALVSVFKKYYCLLVGAMVAYKSLTEIVTEILKEMFPENFLVGILNVIQQAIDAITKFVTEPDQAFADLFEAIVKEIFDHATTNIDIPDFACGTLAEICATVKTLDFAEIDRLLKGYMAKIIVAIAVMLVMYNTIRFVVTIETKLKDDKLKIEEDEDEEVDLKEGGDQGSKDLEDNSEDDDYSSDDETESSDCISNARKWFCNFLSYQPFWIFLSMGIFGLLHLHFSQSLHQKAHQLKVTIIDPAIDQLKEDFSAGLKGYLVTMEAGWCAAFEKLIAPITGFIEKLSSIFKPILEVIVGIGTRILDWITTALEWIDEITLVNTFSKAITAILDCFLMKNFRSWIAIAKLINDKLFNGRWGSFKGGIVALLQKSIESIFKKLQLTKYLKKLLSVHFLIFLKLMTKRSIFLYVYLIVCVILFCQGVLMMIIKFLLGYF